MTTITIKKLHFQFANKKPSGIINGATHKLKVGKQMMNNTFKNSSTTMLILWGSIFLFSTSINASESSDDDKATVQIIAPKLQPQVTGPAYIILDNTAGQSSNAIMSSMATNRSPNCNKADVLQSNTQNCFNLGNNDIQIVQNDGLGNPVSMIGIQNSNSTSYGNSGDKNQTYLFKEKEHIFDIASIRTAADNLALINKPEIANTYGTIPFQEFLKNIVFDKPMYGIVRVTIPLIKDPATQQYTMTNERISRACRTCGPGLTTTLKSGSTICGYTLPENSQITVNGTLMFDWIDCATNNPIPLDELPTDTSKVTFGISVPLNINPANNINGQSMSTIQDIVNITGTNTCASNATCEVPITSAISFSLIPQESKDRFEFTMGTTLTLARFNSLSKSDQYHLLFPSGYANGWETAFSTLGISSSTWKNWGFNVEDSNGTITANDIRKDSFSDMPALIYSGGIISIKHHANISGLIYAAQAIEINQDGAIITTESVQECVPVAFQTSGSDDGGGSADDDPSSTTTDNCGNTTTVSESDDNSSDDGSSDDSSSDDSSSNKKSKSSSSESSDDGSSDDSSSDDGSSSTTTTNLPATTVVTKTIIPSYQYINGSIIVRDGFYFEATKPGGITLISNNPDSYSNTKLKPGTGRRASFTPYTKAPNNEGNENRPGGNGNPNNNANGGNGGNGANNNANVADNSIFTVKRENALPANLNNPQWVEIRPK